MAVRENVRFEGDQMVIHKRHDATALLHQARVLRDAGAGQKGDNKLVGRIPTALIVKWCKEAGVKWSDVQARQEVVRRKILSGDFDKFRVWMGTY